MILFFGSIYSQILSVNYSREIKKGTMRHTNFCTPQLLRRTLGWLFCGALALAFLFSMTALSASAQDTASTDEGVGLADDVVGEVATLPLDDDIAGAVTADENAGAAANSINRDEELPFEIFLDETVTHEELGTTAAVVLPGSPLHPFKRFGWAFQEAFTFDPVADAELKLMHANQQLAETQQLLDENGVADVNPRVLSRALGNYEDMYDEVRAAGSELHDVRAALKTEIDASDVEGVAADPELGVRVEFNETDDLIDKVTSDSLQHHRILVHVQNEVFDAKLEAERRGEGISSAFEGVIAQVEDTQDETLQDLTDFLVEVEDQPDFVADRLSRAFDEESGSDFLSLRHIEVLEAIHDRVPENAKGAIDRAKAKTIENFEVRITALPEDVRVERFENYIEHTSADETRLLSLLEELKYVPGIPEDMLLALEEAKEITVRNLEEKLDLIDDRRVEERFFNGLDPYDVDDLVVLDEMRNRFNKDSDHIQYIDDKREEHVELFKKAFSDVESQLQADLFNELSEEMLTNPSPKTMRLLKELEDEVMQDPTKRAFLEQIKGQMQRQFEDSFALEGDRFMSRISTLDPNDMSVFEHFEFDPFFEDQFAISMAGQFKDHMRDISRPQDFDRFRERFFDVPAYVIDEIRGNDPGFQDAMQFKVRKMEELRAEQEREIARAALDFEERELYHQFDRLDRREDDKFWNELNSVEWDDFEKRGELWEEKISRQYEHTEARFEEQQRIFEERIANDPWCDDVCAQIQRSFLEQDLRHEKERLADDLVRERNRIEFEQDDFKQNNPLADRCSTPETCDQYCRDNAGVPGCEWAVATTLPFFCKPPGFIDQYGGCSYPDDPPPFEQCGEGQYFDFFQQGCVFDPYYRPPTDFIDCGPGFFWNDHFGFCEEEYFACPMVYPMPCPPGFHHEGRNDINGCWIPGECVQDDNIGPGPIICPTFYAPPRACADGEVPIPPPPGDFCGQPSCEYRYNAPPDVVYHTFSDGFIARTYRDVEDYCWSQGTGSGIVDECRKLGVIVAGETYCPPPSWWDPVAGHCRTPQEGCSTAYDTQSCSNRPECEWRDGYCQQLQFNDSYCGDNTCDAGEESWCDSDCDISTAYPCTGWNSDTCLAEAGCVWNNNYCSSEDYVYEGEGWCGDNVCKNGEDASWCPSDCGGSNVQCPANEFNFGETSYACDWNVCEFGCEWDNQGCASGCTDPANDPNYCGYEWTWDATTKSCVQEGVTCDSPNACDSCGNGTDGSWCNYDFQGCPIRCIENTTSGWCGDGECGMGEDADWCAMDCGFPDDSICGDNYCGDNESADSCPQDCGTDVATCPANVYNDYIGNYACDYDYCTAGCLWDSNGCATGCQTDRGQGYCGDGTCGQYETSSSCAEDCSGGATNCPAIYANGYASTGACDYTNCPSGCDFDGNGCPASCYSGTTAGYCGDGHCSGEENSNVTCPADCGENIGSCGDGVCNTNETPASCSTDCQYDYTANCPSTAANNYASTYTCDYTVCDMGCNWDSMGCPSTCMTVDDMASSCGSGWTWNTASMTCVQDGVTCSNPDACSACSGSSWTDGSWCQWDSQGCPTGCQESTGSWCGNGTCDSGENSSWCSSDCGGTSCPSTMYNGYSDGSTCDYAVCPNGCNYDAQGCSYECYEMSGSYCGDGTCDSGETGGWCPVDCGDSSSSCPSNMYNDYTNSYSCSYSTCSDGCEWDSNGCAIGCYTYSEAGYCGDNVCDAGEDDSWCPTDCGSTTVSYVVERSANIWGNMLTRAPQFALEQVVKFGQYLASL